MLSFSTQNITKNCLRCNHFLQSVGGNQSAAPSLLHPYKLPYCATVNQSVL
uniref:Uncharacterized protein n=1 Tax=Arundo donax TaxID=35708 RepID=A0A0A9GCN9_ARUDO